MKVEEIKAKLAVKHSEQLFDIKEEPGHNCPRIDKGIKEWNYVQKSINGFCKDLGRLDNVEAKGIADDIEWEIGRLDIGEEYEELRYQCDQLRKWGTEWKRLALRLIEQKEDLSDCLKDEFYLKLKELETQI